MKRDPRALLWDAREAADAIAMMAEGRSFADFDRDIMLRSAIERQFARAAVRTAVAKAPPARPFQRPSRAQPRRLRGRAPPTHRDIIAFRNILIHGYAAIDRARVWRTVERDLPPLRDALHRLAED